MKNFTTRIAPLFCAALAACEPGPGNEAVPDRAPGPEHHAQVSAIQKHTAAVQSMSEGKSTHVHVVVRLDMDMQGRISPTFCLTPSELDVELVTAGKYDLNCASMGELNDPAAARIIDTANTAFLRSYNGEQPVKSYVHTQSVRVHHDPAFDGSDTYIMYVPEINMVCKTDRMENTSVGVSSNGSMQFLRPGEWPRTMMDGGNPGLGNRPFAVQAGSAYLVCQAIAQIRNFAVQRRMEYLSQLKARPG